MARRKVVFVEHDYVSVEPDRRIIEAAGAEFVDADPQPRPEAFAIGPWDLIFDVRLLPLERDGGNAGRRGACLHFHWYPPFFEFGLATFRRPLCIAGRVGPSMVKRRPLRAYEIAEMSSGIAPVARPGKPARRVVEHDQPRLEGLSFSVCIVGHNPRIEGSRPGVVRV